MKQQKWIYGKPCLQRTLSASWCYLSLTEWCYKQLKQCNNCTRLKLNKCITRIYTMQLQWTVQLIQTCKSCTPDTHNLSPKQLTNEKLNTLQHLQKCTQKGLSPSANKYVFCHMSYISWKTTQNRTVILLFLPKKHLHSRICSRLT